jgi:hypothetical protein
MEEIRRALLAELKQANGNFALTIDCYFVNRGEMLLDFGWSGSTTGQVFASISKSFHPAGPGLATLTQVLSPPFGTGGTRRSEARLED